MTPQLTARPPEPRIHIRVDEWMTKSEFAALWRATNHDFNDAAYELEPVVPGVELVGIDSEGGGMTDRQIKFTDQMAGAILDGIKTVTRRVIKPQPETTEEYLRKHGAWVEGQTLSQYLNNAWRAGFVDVECPYGEPGDHLRVEGDDRLVLEITDVRIEKVQEITIGQICKEGLARSIYEFAPVTQAIPAFAELWDSIYGPGSWDANPYVWVVEFKRITLPLESHNVPAQAR